MTNVDLLLDVVDAIQAWETENRASLHEAHPMDWRPDVLYAEWMQDTNRTPRDSFYIPCSESYRRKAPEYRNGFSNSRDVVGPLWAKLQEIEQKYGVVLDQVMVKKEEGYLVAFWHLPGADVRDYGRAPVAVAAAGAHPVHSEEEKGVA